MNNNFKVKALASYGSWFNKGDILEFENGKCIFNNGNVSSCYDDFKDFISCNMNWHGYLELFKEDNQNEVEKIHNKEFTKQDLKDGMVVELNNGQLRFLFNESLINKNGYIPFDEHFNNELIYNNNVVNNYTIKRIYTTKGRYFSNLFDAHELDLIWERKEEPQPKEMTIEEIEKALGYSVKIIK